MKTTELATGKKYYYTASSVWVEVIYLYETINGYMFTNGEQSEVLTPQSVEQYIEEI